MKKIIYLSVIVAMLCSVDAFGSEYTSAEDDSFGAVDLGAPISVVNQSAISLDNPEQNLRYAVMSAPASESNSDDGES